MRNSKRVLLCCVAAGLIGMSGAAMASHGKAGLWSMTVTMSGGHAMPDMSKLPPEVQARMRAMGMSANGNTMTIQHCMTPSEVAVDVPHMDEHSNKDCKMTNLKVTPHHMTADMVCTGNFVGNGHMDYVFDTDTHYKGVIDMSGTSEGGTAVQNHQTIEGRWVSADCGSVTH
jgi:hypothetical protein